MKYYILLAIVGLGILSFACSSTKAKEAQTETQESTQKLNSEKMISEGFSKGKISASKTAECPYVLTVENYKDNMDPINLKDFFKTEDVPEKVWVKYSNLRMKNRCNLARPISITAIEKRSE